MALRTFEIDTIVNQIMADLDEKNKVPNRIIKAAEKKLKALVSDYKKSDDFKILNKYNLLDNRRLLIFFEGRDEFDVEDYKFSLSPYGFNNEESERFNVNVPLTDNKSVSAYSIINNYNHKLIMSKVRNEVIMFQLGEGLDIDGLIKKIIAKFS